MLGRIQNDLFDLGADLAVPQRDGKAERLRESFGRWLLHNYLFMRIPLARPDRLLTATYPYVRWIYTRTFATAISVPIVW